MKVNLECNVESKTHIGEAVKIFHNNKEYLFSTDEKGFFSHIKITASVPNPEKFYDDIKENNTYIASREFTDLLFKDLQELESILGFTHNLKKINWRNSKVSVVKETEEEQKRVIFSQVYGLPTYPDIVKGINRDTLQTIVEVKTQIPHLVVPLSFYREGIIEHEAHRYINAFINFYFILEGFYSNGKHGERQVINEFKKSEEFIKSVEWVIKSAIYNNQDQHCIILEMLRSRGKQLVTSDSLIYLIVKTRNELLHFQNNPNRLQGTPFTHGKFAAMEFVVLGLALRVLIQKLADAGIYQQAKS